MGSKKKRGSRNEPERLPSGRIPKKGKPSKYGGRGKNTAKYDKNKERNAARKAEKKAALEARKQRELQEQEPGAVLAEHVQKGDLLAVAAPLASRKRAADFFDGDHGQDGREQQLSEPRKSKKPKPNTNGQQTDRQDRERQSNKTKASDNANIPLTKEAAAQNLLDQIPDTSEDDNEEDGGLAEGFESSEIENGSEKEYDEHGAQISTHNGKRKVLKEVQLPKTKSKAGKSEPSAKSEPEKANFIPSKPEKEAVRSPGGDNADGDDPMDRMDNGSDEDDDQTAALIRGFESSDSEAVSGDEGYEAGQAVPDAPTNKGMQKKLLRAEAMAYNDPGVIYVGRIPHGFYEKEMQAYFSQFGEVTRLRLSRNRKTGHSKHYAFVEFASCEVAKIVAETMNNYLLFGHILKVQVVPPERIHEELWKGANRKFKVIPRNRIEAKALAAPKSRETWEKKIDTVSKKREQQMKKLKSMDYEFTPPALKSVDAVPKRNHKEMLEAGEKAEIDGGGGSTVAVPENLKGDGSGEAENNKPKDGKKHKDKHSQGEEMEKSKGQTLDAGEKVPKTGAMEEALAVDVSGEVGAKKAKKDNKHKDKHSKKEKAKEKLDGL